MGAVDRVMSTDEGAMPDEHQNRPRPRIHVQVTRSDQPDEAGEISIDAREEGGPIITIPAQTLARFRRTGEKAGWDAAANLIGYGARLQRDLDAQKADAPDGGAALAIEDARRIADVCQYLYRAIRYLRRDVVLEMTYERLRAGVINREQAALLASDALGTKIAESTWRTAVDDWATEQGLPPLELPRGRPPKNKAQDS